MKKQVHTYSKTERDIQSILKKRKKKTIKLGMMKTFFMVFFLFLSMPYLCSVFFLPKKSSTVPLTSTYTIRIQQNRFAEEITIEEYVTGMLMGMGAEQLHPETIKALSVLLRGNGLLTGADAGYMPVMEQKKKWGTEYSTIKSKLEALQQDTKGIVIIYQGEKVYGPYCAVSGGWTRERMAENSLWQGEYLQSVDSMDDIMAENYLHTYQWSEKDILTASKKWIAIQGEEEKTDNPIGEEIETSKSEGSGISIIAVDGAGYVQTVLVGNRSFTGDVFREGLGLSSPNFQIEKKEGAVKITAKGVGHGYGLSIYGAERMAAKGKKYDEILKYYYDNIALDKIE